MTRQDFKINEFGEIVRKNPVDKPKTVEQQEEQEYSNLEYLVNNHPDRLKDGDRERFEFLKNKLQKGHETNVFQAAKKMLEQKQGGVKNSASSVLAMAAEIKKQNG